MENIEPKRAIYKADLTESDPVITVILFPASKTKFESFKDAIEDEVAELYENTEGRAHYKMFSSIDEAIKYHNENGPDIFSENFRKISNEAELIDFYSKFRHCYAIQTTEKTIEELIFEMGPIFGDNEESMIYNLLDLQEGNPHKVVEYTYE